MIENSTNFTFRLSKDDSKWLDEYAKKTDRTKGGVLRDVLKVMRNGIDAADIKIKGYRTVPIKGHKSVMVPKGEGLENSLETALNTVKVLGLK